MIEGIDGNKARQFLSFIARVNKKQIMQKHALSTVQREIRELRKVSGKQTRKHIEKIEERIFNALKEGGFVHEIEKEESVKQEEAISDDNSNYSAEIMAHELTREERLRQIEDDARAKATTQPIMNMPKIDVHEIEKSLRILEKLQKKIKVKGREERDQLNAVSEKIKMLKQKLKEIKTE